MWIRRLEVTDCAGIAAASVDLEPGLNVLFGPNELGKSSLVEAMRAVLLLQSGSTAAGVLDDWHSDGPPEVALTFERDERVWRVRKTFKRGGGRAFLDYSPDGRDFTTDSRGREVDGRLNEMLGWGALPPGGKGGPRGMPSTLITTALLGRQDEVAAILEGSLADDPTETGREQLNRALEGLAEDPRLKNLLDAVQEKVALAYTATGRRRTGRDSPWTRLKEERLAAEERREQVRSQQEESEGVRFRVNELQRALAEAEAVRDEAKRDLEAARETAARHAELAAAADAFRTADEELERIETLVRTLDEKRAAAQAAEERIADLSDQHAELERAGQRLAEQVAEARERVRELEAGGGEQERRLREQEAENARLVAGRELEEFDRQVEAARRFAELDRKIVELGVRIEEAERRLADARNLIEEADRAIASDRDRLRELRVERLGGRYLAASETLVRRAREVEEARAHARTAAAAEDEAVALRQTAADLRAPGGDKIERLKQLETERRIAREKLAVGLVADLELQAGATAEVRADGATEGVEVGEGRVQGVEARREFRIEIPGVGSFHVRGGSRELVAAKGAADRELESFRRPLLERAGASTEQELYKLARRAESLRRNADERDRIAAAARVRAEGLEDLERGEALARGALERSRGALAEALAEEPGEGASVEEHIRGLDASRREDSEIAEDIRAVERRAAGLRERRRDLASKVDRDSKDLVRDRQERDAGLGELLGTDSDWRDLLQAADRRRAELARRSEAAASRLEAVRAEAADQVGEARENLEKVEQEGASASSRRETKGRLLAARREELAGLEGEIGLHEEALEREDLENARGKRERLQGILTGLEKDVAGVSLADAEELERAAREAEAKVLGIAADLQKHRGALEQVGGAYAEEQALQAKERVEAVRQREDDLEAENEAWKLLAETLREVEQEETAHLGKALVRPVSSRLSELTGGRYGDVAIGPELDAGGIRFAGAKRSFAELSVGTREQIAILLRISIAEALGAFVVLDDQLTQTDGDRMAWLRDLLEEAARRIQIVVLTCHPQDYGPGPPAHVVDLVSRVRRT